MKLTYVALTAGAIAMIGAISMGSMGAPGRKLPVSTALAEPTDAFSQAYENIVNDDAPAPAPADEPRFSAVSEAQAQEPSTNLRNLPDSPTPQTNASTSQPAQQPAAQPTQEPERPAVDESALRYFAQQGDLERLQAEISRLRSLYPNWTPPANPLAVEDGEDEQLNAMWQAYARGNYAEVRQLIQTRQTEEPNWLPPADLIDRLQIAENRSALIQASEDGEYEKVIDLASQSPSILTCAEINVLWLVSEAFAKTDKLNRAMDSYTYIMKNCDNTQERLATLQKALAVMPYEDMKTLISFERPDEQDMPEFQEISENLLRDRFAEAGDDETIVISPDDLAAMEKLANTSNSANDAELLGWYFLIRGSENAAEPWFRKAREEGDSATISQGLALILIELDKAEEAESVMYPWRNDSDEALDTYLNAAVRMLGRIPRKDYPTDVLSRMADVITEAKSMTAAQQFGWYSKDFNQPLAALQWFEAALSWQPWYEPAAYGVTLTLNDMNYKPGVYLMQKIWAPYSERIAWLNDPNAPVTTLENMMATVFELTVLKEANGTSRTVAVPIAEIDLATGQQTPIGATAMPSSPGQPQNGVALTAPVAAPGALGLGAEADTAPANYVPDYYQYYYGGGAAAQSAAPGSPASRVQALERLSIPRSMIRTDPVTGVQTVTVLNTALQPEQNRYQPSAAQIQAAFYTTGQPSEKTEIYRFDEQAYANRDYLRQFQVAYYLNVVGAADASGDQIMVSRLPAGTQLPEGTAIPVADAEPAVVRTSSSTSTRRVASSGGTSSSSGASCWSGRSAENLSPDAALRQGWCLMDLQRPTEAARAFETALGSSSAKNREEAAYGQSLAYMRLGLTNKAAVAASQEPLSRERQLNLQVDILSARAIAAYQGGHYQDTLLLLNQRNQLAPEETGLMVIKGYAYYNLGRYTDAHQVFSALAEMGNPKGMEGLALTRNRLGLPGSN
ncbi:hypothetical protein K7H91_10345 [Martelella mediterranea]|uniref:hypothetical protein n=1 Tax=Martelella mediterranea TaxID=293089 RepID=UPI001E4EA504|nr:hypothetical protein [Martelella mediterranea]MCD1634175.1 hypothetical protein [Martelella mediterranea]